nr:uncharacterized protein LOC129256410 [Lytechinus pictus]
MYRAAALKATKGPNYAALIRDEIAQWERGQTLRVARISEKCCKRDVRGKGEGFCNKCNRKWTSIYTHITVNFKSPDSLVRWRQKCSRCNLLCKMKMPEEEFRKKTRYAIESMERCHQGIFRVPKTDEETKSTPPHKCLLCEKCGFGSGPCCMLRPPKKGQQVIPCKIKVRAS